MPIVGGIVRQAIILRVGEVMHVCVLKDPKSMVQVTYDDVFPVQEVQKALDSVYQQLMTQEIKA